MSSRLRLYFFRTTKMRGRGKYKHLNEGDRLPRQTKPNANIKKVNIEVFLYSYLNQTVSIQHLI